MSAVPVVEGDLLHMPGLTHVVHQLNCLSTYGAGLYAAVARRWPWADVYRRRERGSDGVAIVRTRGDPGCAVLCDPLPDEDAPVVVGVYGQWDVGGPSRSRPGHPAHPEGDTAENRLRWFGEGLDAAAHFIGADALVGFPYGIGCGLAKGDWTAYRAAIEGWSARHGIACRIVKLP